MIPGIVSYLNLPETEVQIGTDGTVPGWGHAIFLDNDNFCRSEMLKYVDVQIEDISERRSEREYDQCEKVLCASLTTNEDNIDLVSIPMKISAYVSLRNI